MSTAVQRVRPQAVPAPPLARAAVIQRNLKRHWIVYLTGIVVPLAVYVAFIGYPLVANFYLSLTDWNGLSTEKKFVGLANYAELLQDPAFSISLTNNIKWAVVSLAVPVFVGLLLAVFLSSGKVFFGGVFRSLMFLPSTISLVAIGVMFALILNPIFGAFNAALRTIGLGFLIQAWLEDPKIVIYTLIGVFTWHYTGMAMIMFHAGINQIPIELYETARIEGAGPIQALWYVTFPMLSPVITVVTMLTVLTSFRAFDIVTVMTRGGPFKSSSLLAYFMYLEAFQKYYFGYGAAIGVVILLLCAAFAVVYLSRVSGGSDYDT